MTCQCGKPNTQNWMHYYFAGYGPCRPMTRELTGRDAENALTALIPSEDPREIAEVLIATRRIIVLAEPRPEPTPKVPAEIHEARTRCCWCGMGWNTHTHSEIVSCVQKAIDSTTLSTPACVEDTARVLCQRYCPQPVDSTQACACRNHRADALALHDQNRCRCAGGTGR